MTVNGGNGQWKWIAGILAALMVGFLPGYISSRNAPTSGQFDEIQQVQQQSQIKLALLAAQNKAMLRAIEDARKRIILLQTKGSQ
jgi:hypothetical protein